MPDTTNSEETARLKSQGRRNLALRRELLRIHAQADTIFDALCNTSGPVTAIGELWGSGLFDCGPQDYEFMIERCLAAVREYNERRTQPMPLVATMLCASD